MENRPWVLRSIAIAAIAGCTVYNTPSVTDNPLPARTDSVYVDAPVKAHLTDGSTVVYSGTILIARDTIRTLETGTAMRYGLTLADSAPADALPLDSVVGMEIYENSVNGPASVMMTLLGIAGTTVGAGALAVAIFGSCPTVYADSAGTQVLEAEGFSYSIAPAFEARDVDRLRSQPDPAGTLRLEVRNEALETHYINQLALLEVRHTQDELVAPDASGHPLALRAFVPPAAARDRAGRDIRSELLDADGGTFRTDQRTIDRATATDLTDYIDLTFPRPSGVDSVALVFRMRNSLLNTVLLYDVMLRDHGARALDWIGQDLQQPGPAANLALWYAGRMGMRVMVRDSATFRRVARIPDTGPIAWKDVAVLVPVPEQGDSIRVRLEFAADNWRIDRVQLALGARRTTMRQVEPTEIQDSNQAADTAAQASVRGADARYLVTAPGQRFSLSFAVGSASTDSARTFLLIWQGYYVEWLRTAWLRGAHTAQPFQPTDTALVEAMRRWSPEREDFERRFFATRLPVR